MIIFKVSNCCCCSYSMNIGNLRLNYLRWLLLIQCHSRALFLVCPIGLSLQHSYLGKASRWTSSKNSGLWVFSLTSSVLHVSWYFRLVSFRAVISFIFCNLFSLGGLQELAANKRPFRFWGGPDGRRGHGCWGLRRRSWLTGKRIRVCYLICISQFGKAQ